jgi:S-adenosylmethionine-diacylglycerol 3-amino-3-carboxypropyl transferase
MTASTVMFCERPMASRFRVKRRRLESATDDRLFFAQVREDPMLEIEALRPQTGGTFIIVGSGGCTALSLLARGADRVIAVDLNSTQNHVTELKAAAISALDIHECLRFLGGAPMDSGARLRQYRTLRPFLSPSAGKYWDGNLESVARGIIGSGVSERFIAALGRVVRTTIHSRDLIDRFLSCESIQEQSDLYRTEWNNRRWKLLFKALLNRWTLNRTYDPGFFSHVENESFSAHFHGVFERAVTQTLARDNYFLHHMLTGSYPAPRTGALPPYLEPSSENRLVARGAEGLELIDGSFQDYLWECDNSSVDGIVLSNICEWMSEDQAARLFSSVARVARPGATVCFRNFVGHTEVPEQLSHLIIEDRAAGLLAIQRDRSCVQSRFAVCTVRKAQ